MNNRQKKIVSIMEIKGEVNVDQLVNQLSASEATIRRDLTILEEADVITRTYGGARMAPSTSLVARTFEEKRQEMRMEKELIAKRAAELVEPGMTIAIDSGTACWRLAATLKEKAPLTVFTCALPVVEELGEIQDITIHCVGGRFRLKNLDFIGMSTVAGFEKLHSDIAFVGVDNMIPGKGLFSIDQESAEIGAAIAGSAERIVALADHSKFNSRGSYKLVNETDIAILVTDQGVNKKIKKQLKSANFELIIVK